jgi:hypothetical protein
MVTGTQTLTAWALGIGELAEMLETHLAEVKHQEELKLWHPELLASPLHDALKEQVGYYLSKSLPGHCLLVYQAPALQPCQTTACGPQATAPAGLCPAGPLSHHLLACQVTALPGPYPTGPPDRCPLAQWTPAMQDHQATTCHKRVPAPPDAGSKPA